MSDSVQPHRRQPTRLRRPWDSPGKNTKVGCHFLLQCMKVKRASEVIQSCLTLSDSIPLNIHVQILAYSNTYSDDYYIYYMGKNPLEEME